jgi:hypothetical protein
MEGAMEPGVGGIGGDGELGMSVPDEEPPHAASVSASAQVRRVASRRLMLSAPS